jgi:hypothetical protein
MDGRRVLLNFVPEEAEEIAELLRRRELEAADVPTHDLGARGNYRS